MRDSARSAASARSGALGPGDGRRARGALRRLSRPACRAHAAASARPAPTPRRWFSAARGETPLVSVIVPCFNHGRYLGSALRRSRARRIRRRGRSSSTTRRPTRDTLALLDELSESASVTVVRLAGERRPEPRPQRRARAGPRALRTARRRRQHPAARTRSSRSSSSSSGAARASASSTRTFSTSATGDDYFAAPATTSTRCSKGNFCDTCSLFDADVFDAGVRFDADIKLGHEDWDLALRAGRARRHRRAAHGTDPALPQVRVQPLRRGRACRSVSTPSATVTPHCSDVMDYRPVGSTRGAPRDQGPLGSGVA